MKVLITALVASVALGAASAAASHGSTSALVCRTFGAECRYAQAVARCESNYNRFARGRAGERGIFQIHPHWFGKRVPGFGVVQPHRLWDAAYNARLAYAIRRAYGWSHWTCAR